MRPIFFAAALALLALGCNRVDCDQLRHERDTARIRLRTDEIGAGLGDSYGAASVAWDRDEVRKASAGRPMDEQRQEQLFGRAFERLGQDRRAQVLRGLGVIDPDARAAFDALKGIRNKYLHLWSHPHDSIEADARNALELARKALGTVLSVSLENGVISLHPALDAYLEAKKRDRGSP